LNTVKASALPVKSSSARAKAPGIRLRIGVSGHRAAPKLPPEAIPHIRQSVDLIFAAIFDAASNAAAEISDKPARLTVVSALAEGSDRIVAEAGLAAGCSLEAILPFARAEYARDFESLLESSRAFVELAGRAFSVFEIDGDPQDRPRAYEAAGFVMLANIDLLIAIWDGKAEDGLGGTGQIISRAIAEGIPVIRVDPSRPEELQSSWSGLGEIPLANALPGDAFISITLNHIGKTVRDILLPPPQKEAANSLAAFLAEKLQRWNLCPWYPLLLYVFAARPIRRSDFDISYTLSQALWQKYFEVVPSDKAQRPAIEEILLPAYSAADNLAVYYAQVYRSAYVFNFLFAAVAVILALGGIFVHEPQVKSYLVAAELLVILAVLMTWLFGHRRQWHRRWLEYRRLAESLRQMRILALVGLGGPAQRPRPSIDGQDWSSWYAWSVRRLLPLPDRAIDVAYLTAVRDVTRADEIASQTTYHSKNAALTEKLDETMHRSGHILFGLTAVICLAFVVSEWLLDFPSHSYAHTDIILGLLTLVTALLPMLGATLGAINVQGEFSTVREQSERTTQRLATLDLALQNEELTFARLCDRVEKTSDVMMADVDEWQTVFRTRPLSLPA
jgi:hypothetical protein